MPLQTNQLSPRQKLLFVINPISGGKSKDRIPILIKKYLNHTRYDYQILWWSNSDELKTMLCPTVLTNYYAVIAVGGDGTINLLAQYIKNSTQALGIIPMGSGNGLARSLNIPMQVKNAIEKLNTAKLKSIDLGSINGHLFVNVAGIGFDASVSKAFTKSTKRGFFGYARTIYQEFGKSASCDFHVEWPNGKDEKKGFMLCVANGTQWGNDFYVAPDASLDDGILDVVVLPKPKLAGTLKMARKLVSKEMKPSWSVKSLQVHAGSNMAFHADGEYLGQSDQFHIQNMPGALSLLI